MTQTPNKPQEPPNPLESTPLMPLRTSAVAVAVTAMMGTSGYWLRSVASSRYAGRKSAGWPWKWDGRVLATITRTHVQHGGRVSHANARHLSTAHAPAGAPSQGHALG